MKLIYEIIIDRLISDKMIEREDAEMYTYGLQQVCMNLVNIIMLMIFKWYVISKCIILGGIALCCSMIFGMLNTYLN